MKTLKNLAGLVVFLGVAYVVWHMFKSGDLKIPEKEMGPEEARIVALANEFVTIQRSYGESSRGAGFGAGQMGSAAADAIDQAKDLERRVRSAKTGLTSAIAIKRADDLLDDLHAFLKSAR